VWLGEHAQAAKSLEGLRSYTILALDGRSLPYDGIAVTVFDSRAAADAAFADPELAKQLRRTRDDFAESVEVFFAEELVVVRGGIPDGNAGPEDKS
jgi:hypothetical protein